MVTASLPSPPDSESSGFAAELCTRVLSAVHWSARHNSSHSLLCVPATHNSVAVSAQARVWRRPQDARCQEDAREPPGEAAGECSAGPALRCVLTRVVHQEEMEQREIRKELAEIDRVLGIEVACC